MPRDIYERFRVAQEKRLKDPKVKAEMERLKKEEEEKKRNS